MRLAADFTGHEGAVSDPSQWLVAPHTHEEQEKQTKRTNHTPEEKTVASVLRVPSCGTQEVPRADCYSLTRHSRQKAIKSHAEYLVSQQTGKETQTRYLKKRDNKWMN